MKYKIRESIRKIINESIGNENPKPLSSKVFIQPEMIPLGANYHLHHGMLMMIPVDKIDGLDPTHGDYYDEDLDDYVEFKSGKTIEKPIEVVYDKNRNLYMLYDGNHRVAQAKINGDKYIKAFVQADKETYAKWKRLIGLNENLIKENSKFKNIFIRSSRNGFLYEAYPPKLFIDKKGRKVVISLTQDMSTNKYYTIVAHELGKWSKFKSPTIKNGFVLGRTIGYLWLIKGKDGVFRSNNTLSDAFKVADDYKRSGIGTAMHDYANEILGIKTGISNTPSSDAKNFWKNRTALDEDYPIMFKMDEFKTLTTFKERIRYCESFLERISSGSDRIVYKIDNNKVLKLAKNKKGLVQNEVEVDFSKETYINYLFAKVYDYDSNFLWIEMQRAEKMTEKKFAQINKYSFKDFVKVLTEKYYDVVSPIKINTIANVNPEIKDKIIEDEFYIDIVDYMVGYEIPIGDLTRISSYGIVNGNEIVLVDFGLTEDVFQNYYKKIAEAKNVNSLKLYVRKIINEQFIDEQLIDEDYESIQEIKALANKVLHAMGDKSLEFLIDWGDTYKVLTKDWEDKKKLHDENNFKVNGVSVKPEDFEKYMGQKPNITIPPIAAVNLKEVGSEFIKEFPKLKNFILASQHTVIGVSPNFIGRKNSKGIKGRYSHIEGDKYNVDFNRRITLYYGQDFADKLMKSILESNGDFDKTDVYLDLYYQFISTLIHELQHNYDDFRSDSKAYKTKEFKNFRKFSQNLASQEIIDKEQFYQRNLKYLNLPHEIWARFSQAMNRVRFKKTDYIKNSEGKYYMDTKMNNIHDVVKDFKLNFDGFEILTDNMKKRLIRKVAQFWHIEQGKVKKEMENPEVFD